MRQFAALASLIGGMSAFVGFWTAYQLDLPVGPTDVVILGVIYGAGWLGAKVLSGRARRMVRT